VDKNSQQIIRQAKQHLMGDLGRYIPRDQKAVLADLLRGEEREGFARTLNELADRIAKMHHTYQQEGKGDDAIVHLHYFAGGRANWYVTEKDVDGGTQQAFGVADPYGDGGEKGYISIDEIVATRGTEIDLYWTPKPLRECRRA
jgi:hypothetical protein